LAHRWWDPTSEFKPLHQINPLRLDWIDGFATLAGKRVLDIGCGGGILAESMARRGAADVLGIDLAEKSLKVADLHALDAGIMNVRYQAISAEDLAQQQPAQFDVVTCMEMLEHVPDPSSIIRAASALCKPNGWVFFSTINRTPKSFALAIVAAEYVLGMLPRGTHEYRKLIQPAELARCARQAGLRLIELKGMTYLPLTDQYHLSKDVGINYLMAYQKHTDQV
jgi:2-polyprenyl-6-hydroxyphenyl methylase/3-demethylubiquinone-9 3-methyltransferase